MPDDYRKTAAEIEGLLLPEGRLEANEVRHSQRRRLMLALALESHRNGYEVTSVESIADTAMLSKTTLYALFVSKRGLLEAAVSQFAGLVGPRIEVAAGSESRWTEAVAASLEALVETMVSEPALARLTFVEGPAILASQEPSDFAVLNSIFVACDAAADAPQSVFEELTRLITLGGMSAALGDRLLRGRSTGIPELTESLTYLAINSRLGPEIAGKMVAG